MPSINRIHQPGEQYLGQRSRSQAHFFSHFRSNWQTQQMRESATNMPRTRCLVAVDLTPSFITRICRGLRARTTTTPPEAQDSIAGGLRQVSIWEELTNISRR